MSLFWRGPTLLVRVRLGRVWSSGVGRVGTNTDYKAISVQLQLQLPAGMELGNFQRIFLVNQIVDTKTNHRVLTPKQLNLVFHIFHIFHIAKLSSSRQLQLQLN